MLRCAVVGARGYTGIEIVKILLRHPEVEISYLTSSAEVTIPVQQYIHDVDPSVDILIKRHAASEVVADSDIVFLALPHRVSMATAPKYLTKDTVVIDLSADYRFKSARMYEKQYGVDHVSKELCKKAVYGLSELFTDQIARAQLIANPGCFPTGTLLGLAPLLQKNLIKENSIIIDAKTGVSGAGRNSTEVTHFCNVQDNFKAYKVNKHQHAPEMTTQLNRFTKKPVGITFVPHLLPLSRGILSTIYCDCRKGVTAKTIEAVFAEAYDDKTFIRVKGRESFPEIAGVVHTNFCDIGFTFDKKTSRLIVITAIDNLIKGAAGQAVQNMNIRCGFREDSGFFKAPNNLVKLKPDLLD